MEKLISIENLIKQAKKAGVDFGKGDPYNRLRYYTKIGWLPHMIRKKEKGDSAKGHYPTWALERLILIEKLKGTGFSNEEITKRLSKKNYIQPIRNALKTPQIKKLAIVYTIVILLGMVLAHELEIISLGKQKSLVITQTQPSTPNQIIDSGTAFVLKDQVRAFVRTKNVLETHKIYVSFNGNIIPALRFWVGDKKPLEGFYVELDAPVSNEVEFNWWITK